MTKKEQRDIGKKAKLREQQLLHAFADVLSEKGDLYGLITAKLAFEDLNAQALGVPIETPELIKESLEHAKTVAMARRSKIRKDFYDRMTMPVSDSTKSLGPHLWPNYGTQDWANRFYGKYATHFFDNLSQSSSPRGIAVIAEKILENIGENVFFGVDDPTLFLFFKEYLTALRVDLKQRMREFGYTDESAYQAIELIEQKCEAYADSFKVMKEWMMADTNNVYDHPFFEVAMDYAADEGRSLLDILNTAEAEDDVKPLAWERFGQLLHSMEVSKKGYVHMLTPLLFAKAQKIAAAEMGGEPDEKASAEEIAEFFEKTLGRAHEIYWEALDTLPKTDPFTGKKIKTQSFATEEIMPILKGLDDKLKLLEMPIHGRSH